MIYIGAVDPSFEANGVFDSSETKGSIITNIKMLEQPSSIIP